MQHLLDGVESIHDAVHRTLARRVHRVGQRAVRHRRRLLDVRLLPPRRGAADPAHARRPAAHHRAVRAPVEGLLVVVRRRPHGRRAGRRHLERRVPRRRLSARRGSCGATSRSPTPRCTRAARTPRSPPRRCATRDARIGEILAAVERAGVFDDTAFVLVADHGMEETDPAVRGDWDVSLARRGHRRSATRATGSSTSARADRGLTPTTWCPRPCR